MQSELIQPPPPETAIAPGSGSAAVDSANAVTGGDWSFDLQALMDSLSTPFGQGLLIAGVLIGVVLFLLGSRLARPACAISGLVIGGLGLAMASRFFGMEQYIVFALFVGAIVFCLVAWVLFRLWMGISCAILLALLAPAIAIGLQGKAESVRTDLEQFDSQSLQFNSEGMQFDQSLLDNEEAKAALWEQVNAVFEPIRELALNMWENLGGAGRTTVLVAALIGAVIGFLLGLITPYNSAMVQTAVIGAALIVACAAALLKIHAPDIAARIPESPGPILLILGLITLHGVAIQWTLFRKKVDKKSR